MGTKTEQDVVVVKNLATGVERTFKGVTPRQALIAAWEQDQGNHSTWSYDKTRCPVQRGEYHLFADDLAVKIR